MAKIELAVSEQSCELKDAPPPQKGVPFVVDRADWENWLRDHGLAEGERLNA